MKCAYCDKELDLKRFIRDEGDGEFVHERFVFVCDKCKIVVSPSLVLLSKNETEQEKQSLRRLYFKQIKIAGQNDKPN